MGHTASDFADIRKKKRAKVLMFKTLYTMADEQVLRGHMVYHTTSNFADTQPLNPQTVRSGWLPEERQLQRPVNGQSTKKRIEEAGAIILDYVYRGKDTEHIASPPVTSAANEI